MLFGEVTVQPSSKMTERRQAWPKPSAMSASSQIFFAEGCSTKGILRPWSSCMGKGGGRPGARGLIATMIAAVTK